MKKFMLTVLTLTTLLTACNQGGTIEDLQEPTHHVAQGLEFIIAPESTSLLSEEHVLVDVDTKSSELISLVEIKDNQALLIANQQGQLTITMRTKTDDFERKIQIQQIDSVEMYTRCAGSPQNAPAAKYAVAGASLETTYILRAKDGTVLQGLDYLKVAFPVQRTVKIDRSGDEYTRFVAHHEYKVPDTPGKWVVSNETDNTTIANVEVREALNIPSFAIYDIADLASQDKTLRIKRMVAGDLLSGSVKPLVNGSFVCGWEKLNYVLASDTPKTCKVLSGQAINAEHNISVEALEAGLCNISIRSTSDDYIDTLILHIKDPE